MEFEGPLAEAGKLLRSLGLGTRRKGRNAILAQAGRREFGERWLLQNAAGDSPDPGLLGRVEGRRRRHDARGATLMVGEPVLGGMQEINTFGSLRVVSAKRVEADAYTALRETLWVLAERWRYRLFNQAVAAALVAEKLQEPRVQARLNERLEQARSYERVTWSRFERLRMRIAVRELEPQERDGERERLRAVFDELGRIAAGMEGDARYVFRLGSSGRAFRRSR